MTIQWKQRIGITMIHIVMAIFLIAGVAKLLDLSAFELDLHTWSLLPRKLLIPLAVVIPTLELLVAGSWFARLWRRGVASSAAILLLAFTSAYAAHLAFADAPRCNCFGILMRFERFQQGTEVAIIRNLFLLVVIVIGCLLLRPPRANLPQADRQGHGLDGDGADERVRHSNGFSLLEMLLVIALIGILLAMVIPSLAGFRRSAHRVVALSKLRTHAQVFNAYTDDYKEVFPYSMDPEATHSIRRHNSGVVIQLVYFAGVNTWHWPLLTDYYADTLDNEVFATAGDEDNYPFSSFWYSATFLARPEFWNERTRTGPAQWRPTSQSDVIFPSKKGLLLNARTMFPRPEDLPDPLHRVDIAFLDASARATPLNNITTPYLRGEGDWHGSWFGNGIKVMHTIDGVRGRDEQ